ncbi:MAG: hypothetical protein IPK14_07405 [Blastocatellia bacterium]|nr:hypothetical protein [Blastocatellia bacterium]MBL8195927.1 hypothetical protein [Blastocatellia bacterium]MBN8725742.1 hypothetical protein [Acidobacteriota bacterium]
MQISRLSIDKQIQLAWGLLYEIEVIEDMPLEDMFVRLKKVNQCIVAINKRKRLTEKQKEKLTNLEKWYQSYDIKRLEQDIKKQAKK